MVEYSVVCLFVSIQSSGFGLRAQLKGGGEDEVYGQGVGVTFFNLQKLKCKIIFYCFISLLLTKIQLKDLNIYKS